MNPPSRDHRSTFHQGLDEVTGDLVRLAAMVNEVITLGTEALLEVDLDTAQTLIDNDDVLDALSIDVEERCFHLLALHQPVAGDLRQLVASLKINAEIERSGDLVVNIAKATRRIYGTEFTPALRGHIQQMSDEAARLCRLAVDAYAEHDGSLGAALDDIDDRLDTIHAEFIQSVFEAHRSEAIDLQVAVQLALVGRYYERIGDHAVNIGERVRFMADGYLPEHDGAAKARARAERDNSELGTLWDGEANGGRRG